MMDLSRWAKQQGRSGLEGLSRLVSVLSNQGGTIYCALLTIALIWAHTLVWVWVGHIFVGEFDPGSG